MSLIRSGMQSLAADFRRINGETVTYSQGGADYEITAVRGGSEFDDVASDMDARITTKTMDWIVYTDDLPSCIQQPERGHTITTSTGEVFEAYPGPSGHTWRWLNSHRTGYRIHTVLRHDSQ